MNSKKKLKNTYLIKKQNSENPYHIHPVYTNKI